MMTLASEAMAWIDRSIPPSMMTKLTPQARMNTVTVSLASCSSVLTDRKRGSTAPIPTTSTSSVMAGTHRRSDSSEDRPRVMGGASVSWPSSNHLADEVDRPRLGPGLGFDALGHRAVLHHENGVAQPDRLLQR